MFGEKQPGLCDLCSVSPGRVYTSPPVSPSIGGGVKVQSLPARGGVVAALNVGVGATQASVAELNGLYLAPLLAVQAELRAMLG